MDRFSRFAVASARMAVEDAGLTITDALRPRAGALVGSGIGGLDSFGSQTILAEERGVDRVSPLFIPWVIANMAAAQVSMELGLKGPLSCVSTACASGNHALGDATEVIRRGQADVMLAGGAEASITRVGVAAFNAMKALSTRNDDPAAASRPFDVSRDGFVMGEAGAILVLESLEHAEGRGAEPYCEVLGYGLTGDAHHLTEPDPTGEAPAAAITMALADGQIAPERVDYVNAHATSTPVGDPNEVRALRLALGDAVAARTMVSSTKSMHGHCLGAAGGVEGALTALTIREGVVPPTINLDELDPGCAGVDHVANVARDGRRPRGRLDRLRVRRPQRDPGAGPPGGPVGAARWFAASGPCSTARAPGSTGPAGPAGPVVGARASASPSAASRSATPCGGCPRPG